MGFDLIVEYLEGMAVNLTVFILYHFAQSRKLFLKLMLICKSALKGHLNSGCFPAKNGRETLADWN